MTSRIVATFMIAVVAVVGCGDDSTPAAPSQPPPVTPEPPTPPPPPEPPTLRFEWDPTPFSEMVQGDHGFFRVNVYRDDQRERLREGVSSSNVSVIHLKLEGDRWRYTAGNPGEAQIRVTYEGEVRLNHTIRVPAPQGSVLVRYYRLPNNRAIEYNVYAEESTPAHRLRFVFTNEFDRVQCGQEIPSIPAGRSSGADYVWFQYDCSPRQDRMPWERLVISSLTSDSRPGGPAVRQEECSGFRDCP